MAAREPAPPAMDSASFPDGTHVSLWIREYEEYLLAAEDGESVTRGRQDAHGALHAAWAVHRLARGGADYVLFHSASYGRYLALVEDEEFDYRPVQCTYDSPEQDNVLFQAVGAEDGSDDIHLRHFTFRDWSRPDDEDTALPGPWPLHWVVEAIPSRQLPPELPQPIPVNLVQPPQVVLRRTIYYVRADDQGNFNPQPQQWRVLEQFEGQSVFNLRRDLAAALGEANNDDLGITLCLWAGANGRLTPLAIDLPSNENPMWIVVLTTGSPAAQELVYANVDPPNVDAP